jgi:hypothetical protein
MILVLKASKNCLTVGLLFESQRKGTTQNVFKNVLNSGIMLQDSQNLYTSIFSTQAGQHKYHSHQFCDVVNVLNVVNHPGVRYSSSFPYSVTCMRTVGTKYANQLLARGNMFHTVRAAKLFIVSSTNIVIAKYSLLNVPEKVVPITLSCS